MDPDAKDVWGTCPECEWIADVSSRPDWSEQPPSHKPHSWIGIEPPTSCTNPDCVVRK